MITVEHVTKTHVAYTAVDVDIQIFTEGLGQAIFSAHVLAGDLAKRVRDLGFTLIAVIPAGSPQTTTEKE